MCAGYVCMYSTDPSNPGMKDLYGTDQANRKPALHRSCRCFNIRLTSTRQRELTTVGRTDHTDHTDQGSIHLFIYQVSIYLPLKYLDDQVRRGNQWRWPILCRSFGAGRRVGHACTTIAYTLCGPRGHSLALRTGVQRDHGPSPPARWVLYCGHLPYYHGGTIVNRTKYCW